MLKPVTNDFNFELHDVAFSCAILRRCRFDN
jgi:hypothetical protein